VSWRERPVAVVVPVYNEGPALERVVTTMPDFVDTVIVVDDGSTPPVASQISKTRSKVVLIRHDHNRGVGAAIASGYKKALELGAGVVAVMGGDGQMDPNELLPLVDAVASGEADYAKGNRFMSGMAFQAMPLTRYIGNVALSWATRAITGLPLFDSQCGFTAVDTRVLALLPLDDLYPRYGVPNDILARLARMRATIVERPVTPLYPAKHSHMNLWTVPFTLGPLLFKLWWRRSEPPDVVLAAVEPSEVADVAP
jgi:glycosyltransferase involved in cell wall biosynthesis